MGNRRRFCRRFLKHLFMVDEKLLTVKVSYSDISDKFFIDFWDGDKYLVSVIVNQKVAEAISRETDIKIMIQ